jgi:hypothetical protein
MKNNTTSAENTSGFSHARTALVRDLICNGNFEEDAGYVRDLLSLEKLLGLQRKDAKIGWAAGIRLHQLKKQYPLEAVRIAALLEGEKFNRSEFRLAREMRLRVIEATTEIDETNAEIDLLYQRLDWLKAKLQFGP